MAKTRTEYMREYRARKSEKHDLGAAPEPTPAKRPIKRDKNGNGPIDWPAIIQRMTQHQRDMILQKVTKQK